MIEGTFTDSPDIFFIVGFPRSGSSMLVQLLNEHPKLSVQHESKFIPGFFDYFKSSFPKKEYSTIATKLSILLKNKARFTGLVKHEEILSFLESIDDLSIEQAYAALVYKIIKNNEKQTASLIGDKTPGYVFHVELLIKLFPKAKFVHLVRDGRDAFLSIKNLSWGPDNVYFAAKEWNKYLFAWDNLKKSTTQHLEIKYEDLISDPATSIKLLCQFFNVEYSNEYFKQFKIKKNNIEKWKNKFNMRPGEVHIFQEISKDQLSSRAYALKNTKFKNWRLFIPIFIVDQIWKRIYNKILQSKVFN